MASSDSEILFHTGRQDDPVPGSIGVAVLNRPKALNALNQAMCETLHRLYSDWEISPDVHAVLLKGAGGKAFCAGGDVKGMVQLLLAGQQDKAISFFRAEYTLNHMLGTMHMPHIALLDGIVMGGGAGISVHGQFRIATERTVFAMPECGIGLFPDVGASYFLPRLRGQLGTYLGLTGRRLKGIEVLEAGLATHFVPSQKLSQLEDTLHSLGPSARDSGSIGRAIASVQEDTPAASELLGELPAVDACFGHDRLEDICAALRQRGDSWAEETLQNLSKLSPLSQKVTLREVREGAGKPLEECLKMEFRMVHHCCAGRTDFIEGVKALLIEKRGQAKWDPASIEQVTPEMVDAFFQRVPQELELPPRAGRVMAKL
ncbi:g6837 [Coccomyxa viridis]|uniref:3-hydroxyisobutyryl-CoA hydrolase n=1 Tax=Coccomyxa viridis TaxID=1274662 RepID=A0ABP1FWC0_9CHLO